MAMKNWNNEVYWVCAQCGNLTYIVTAALDKKYPLGGVSKMSTYHTGKCEACGKDNIPVTEARDFWLPQFQPHQLVRRTES